jgi:DNA primase
MKTQSPTVEDVIAKLKSVTYVTETRDGWEVLCPFHDDTRPSMKVWRRGGWCCLGCQEHGNHARLLEKLDGVGMDNLRTSNASKMRQCKSGRNTFGTPVKEYIYRDESGQPLYKVIRFVPKSFAQMRWTGNKWEWGLKGTRRILYNLNLIASDAKATVVMVEGEKDADLLIRHGILATTCPMGAGKWRGEYGESLRGRKVILIPDNDEQGVSHMAAIRAYLSKNKIADDVRLIRIPDEFKDVSEWGQVDKVKELLNET